MSIKPEWKDAPEWAKRSGSLTYDLAAVELDTALEQALTQQRGEETPIAWVEIGQFLLSRPEEWELRRKQREPQDQPLYTTPQPGAEALREDSARLEWIESQIREYGDGYTEPREAGWAIQWQQERPDHYWPGLRAWIDEERRRTSADELESLLARGAE